jgi:hypothetical protein
VGTASTGAGALPPAVLAWLRQLAIGVSIHRLYAGQQVDAALEAAARIGATAASALAAGPVAVILRADGVVGAPPDAALARLAAVCFERRIEHLMLVTIPEVEELQALFEVLGEEPEALERDGGAQACLAAAGVRAIVAREDIPDAEHGEPVDELAAAAADLDLGSEPSELGPLWRPYPGADAEGYYAHLLRLAAEHPAERLARTSFHRQAMDGAATLPPEERARFERLLLGRLQQDGLAEGLLGHLTDIGLADLVGRVASAQGVDPRGLAVELSHRLDRSEDLPRLTLERRIAANLDAGQVGARPIPVPPTPSAHPLARAFPVDASEGRHLANLALIDVLAGGPRREHLDPLVEAVALQVRVDVAAGDVAGLTELLDAWHLGRRLAPDGLRVPELPADALDEPTVLAALAHGSGTATALLEPFASAAVVHLVAALEPERSETVRRAAAAVLRPLAVDHPEAIGAAIGPRSVASRLALLDVLRHVDHPSVVPVLSRLAQHRDPVLLARVVEVLEQLDATAAAPVLGAIVSRTEDRALQRRGLEALAARPVPAAQDLLERFADRATSPLPRTARRLARNLARARR